MPSTPDANLLLAALPDASCRALLPHLELVNMPQGMVVYGSGGRTNDVYFPTDSVVSLMYVLEDGASTQVAVVGREGVVGIALFMGGETTPSRAVVQFSGYGYRIGAVALKRAFKADVDLQHLLLMRFTQALFAQMAQTAVCIRHHTLDQQLCRWLLVNLDRMRTRELPVTQEQIANMLGVRREGVTACARKLQADGVIRYRRGLIEVADREGLETRACECYAVVRKEYDRLLPATHSTA